MYQTIYVPVDNSEYSNRAVETAVQIGSKFGAKIIGCHVYAAKMHDYRFKQMEFTLPGEYLLEEEIERQRRIHDSLITMGLELISDSYLDVLGARCREAGLAHERKMMDGKHHIELVKDIKESSYDLTIMGVLGVGKTRDSIIGSVCENVARQTDKDLLIVKHLPKAGEPERDTILVGVDGSPQSFGAVCTALELAKKFGKKVELIGVYDPYLHYAVFNSIVDVLSEKAAKVFRFEEQNQLHEEIIDCGLAQIYQSHLNVAAKMSEAAAEGVEISKTLLDGKAFQKILARAREIQPWLLILGRIGVHSPKEGVSLGSNTENLLRLVPCDLLLSTRLEHPAIDVKASETILWTPEAESRMHRIPPAVRGIARTGILRLALEQGHSVVTNTVIDEAMDRFMPKYAAQATTKLAGRLVIEQAKAGGVSLCRSCGVTAAVGEAKRCAVCNGTEFDQLTPEVVEQIVNAEGGAEEEVTYDGRKLRWSRDAREQLLRIEDPYQKRRAKARIEKVARMRRIDTITLEFASSVLMDEVGQLLFDPVEPRASDPALGLKPQPPEQDKQLRGVDERGGELRSVFAWEDAAMARLFKVPAGFMRERTQQRAEELALQAGAEEVSYAMLDAAINQGKESMVQALLESGQLTAEQEELVRSVADARQSGAPAEATESGSCPFSALFKSEAENSKSTTGATNSGPTSNVYKGVVAQVLNEVGVMSELQKKRERLKS